MAEHKTVWLLTAAKSTTGKGSDTWDAKPCHMKEVIIHDSFIKKQFSMTDHIAH